MSGKPGKRLVSKRRYAWMMAGRTTLLSSALLCSIAGAYGVVLITLTTKRYYEVVRTLQSAHPRLSSLFLHVFIRTTLTALAFYVVAYCLWRKERTIERVAPITKHNTSSLPPQESLVRPSDLPPSDQQAELLRAGGPGQETTQEELLRATNGTRQEAS